MQSVHQFLATGSPLSAFFWIDVAVTSAAAWLWVCAFGHARRGLLEATLAWTWSLIAIVATTGTILGIAGGFGPFGFSAAHLAMLGIALGCRRHQLKQDCDQFVRLLNSVQVLSFNERVVALVLVLILAALCVIAAVAEPAVMDSLNYHLPRFAHWLQEGRIQMIGSSDERLDYISSLPEIVMAWLIGPVKEGFRGTVLLQALGGTMTVGATLGFARISGLSRTAALLAGGLLFGMANVAIQFTSSQTDLFTTGVFASAFYLWLVALQRGEVSLPGALGAGLALGAKGTLFYFAPSALLWIAWFGRYNRLRPTQWLYTVLAAAAGVALFAGPGMWRNWQTYGDLRGPPHWVQKFHPHLASFEARVEKLKWNVISAAAQNFDPQSQPDILQAAARQVGLSLVDLLPESDPYTFLGQGRRSGLTQLLFRKTPDADVASFGIITLFIFVVATLVAILHVHQKFARMILVWSGGIWIFFLYFNSLHQWHPFSFRYYVLAAPWIAVVSAWGIEQAKGNWRFALWTIVTLSTASVIWRMTCWTHQGGIQTVVHPERTIGSSVAHDWRLWSQSLSSNESPFILALPDNRPLAAFYRQSTPRNVQFLTIDDNDPATAEDLVRGKNAWLIVPAVKLLGHEGRVRAKTWLYGGDEFHPCSLAAYHALEPGEHPVPFLYRERWASTPQSLQKELLVKTFEDASLRLTIQNPTDTDSSFTWSTPLAQGRETAPRNTTIQLILPVAANAVNDVRLQFAGVSYDDGTKPIIALRP